MGTTRKRCFIAVSLPLEVRQYLADYQSKLKELNLKAGWPDPQKFHITLAFVGDVDNFQVDKIRKAMDRSVSNHPGFYLKPSGLGVFPNANKARVLWSGLNDKTGGLRKIHSSLRSSLKHAGITQLAGKYTPHITLARLKKTPSKKLIQKLLYTESSSPVPDFHVDSIDLYQSRLVSQGAIHTRLYRTCLDSPD